MKKMLLAILTAAVLALQGCSVSNTAATSRNPPSEESLLKPESTSVPDARSESVPSKFYPLDHFYRWAKDGSLVLQYKDTLTWIASDNAEGTTIEFTRPPEFVSQTLTAGEKYVFSAYNIARQNGLPDAAARVLHRDGGYSLVNCAVFDRAGSLVRTFPTATAEELQQDYMSFEINSPICNFSEEVCWMDETHLAIDDSVRVFVCDVETGEIVPVKDYSADNVRGFPDETFSTVPPSYADGGKYYFTASGYTDRRSGKLPAQHFYAVDTRGIVEEIFSDPDAWFMKAENGLLSFDVIHLGRENRTIEVLFRNLDGGDTGSIGPLRVDQLKDVIHGCGLISYTEFSRFHAIDTHTGQETVFDPMTYDEDLPETLDACYSYTLLGARDRGGIQFLYTANTYPLGESSAGGTSCLFLYDTGSGTRRFIESGCSFAANPQMTAVWESSGGGEMRLIPLPEV